MKQGRFFLLRQERELRGWSRAYIAEQIGVDIATVGRWERGETLPHPHYRQKLCTLFEKSAQELGILSNAMDEGEYETAIPDSHSQRSPIAKKGTVHSQTQQSISTSQPTVTAHPTPEIVSVENESSINKMLNLMAQQNRQRMLRKMRTFWINGVLEQSLSGTALITLEIKEQHDAVIDPWVLTLQQSEVVPYPLPEGIHISQVYDEADGELLILGEPGSGKTTLLLELARVLLNRAVEEETHPIPVVFNLASWAIKRAPLNDWLVEELCSKYQVPQKLAQAWVQTERILPLLDGLDEVKAVARSTCIETINAYRQKHNLLPMVVCCRNSDYLAQRARLLLRRGIILQPLGSRQIETYLTSGEEKLSNLHHALQVDPILQELATSPLMLSILVQTYHDKAILRFSGSHSLEAPHHEVFANYVQHMLTHRKSRSRYTTKQTLRWLTWLAKQLEQQQQTEFYIERIQPSWLDKPGAFRWYNCLLVGLLVALLGGIIGMLADVPLYEIIHKQLFVFFTHSVVSNEQCADTLPAFDTFPESIASLLALPSVGLLYGIAFGVGGGLIGSLLGLRDPQLQSVEIRTRSTRLYRRIFALLLWSGCGSIFVLINLLWVPCPLPSDIYNQIAEELSYGLAGVLVGGLIGGLVGDLFGARKNNIVLVETLVRTHVLGRQRMIVLLLGAACGIVVGGGTSLAYEVYIKFALWPNHLLISALVGGLLGSIIGGWLGGFSHHTLEERVLVKPNEGIHRSARNGLIIGLPIGLALSSFAFGLVLWLIPTHISDGLLWCIPLGLIVTVILFLLNGGYACLQHAVLRFILWCQGYIPWNYADFLDEAAERLLLRKVGGGYIFIHRLLLDYFTTRRESNM